MQQGKRPSIAELKRSIRDLASDPAGVPALDLMNSVSCDESTAGERPQYGDRGVDNNWATSGSSGRSDEAAGVVYEAEQLSLGEPSP